MHSISYCVQCTIITTSSSINPFDDDATASIELLIVVLRLQKAEETRDLSSSQTLSFSLSRYYVTQ